MAQITQEQQLRREIEAARADIERVRLDLGETLDQLSDRASPRSIVQRRKARMGARWRSVRESVMGSGQQVTANVAGSAHQLADQASSAVSSVADQARGAPELIQHQTQGNPLAAGLIAFGAGFLVSTLIPPSEPERQAAGALQEKLEPVKERAIEAGQGLKEQVQQAATEGLGHVKESASEAAQHVKQDVDDAGGQVKDHAQQGLQSVRDSVDLRRTEAPEANRAGRPNDAHRTAHRHRNHRRRR